MAGIPCRHVSHLRHTTGNVSHPFVPARSSTLALWLPCLFSYVLLARSSCFMAVAMLSSGQRKVVSIAAITILVVLALFSTPPRSHDTHADHSFLTIWNAGNTKNELPPQPRLPPSTPASVGLIPRHIWQIFFYDQTNPSVLGHVATWHSLNPECTYTRLTRPGL